MPPSSRSARDIGGFVSGGCIDLGGLKTPDDRLCWDFGVSKATARSSGKLQSKRGSILSSGRYYCRNMSRVIRDGGPMQGRLHRTRREAPCTQAAVEDEGRFRFVEAFESE